MSEDYARWLENEIAMVLTFDPPRPSDPFDRIPNADDGEYAGTELETPQQRERRTAEREGVEP